MAKIRLRKEKTTVAGKMCIKWWFYIS